MPWVLLGAIALLGSAGLLIWATVDNQGARLSALEARHEDDHRALAYAEADVRRLGGLVENQRLQLKAMGEQLGWADDRARTKVLTQQLPKP